MMRIEDLWGTLRSGPPGGQRRIDASHPLDIYAHFEQPNRPGMLVVCDRKPPDTPNMQSLSVESASRTDGRWSLLLVLEEPRLIAVFAELCHDIIDFTRADVDPGNAGSAVLSRIDRWKKLLLASPKGLDRSRLRGLIGELLVLERHVLPDIGPDAAIRAWIGPLGSSQDFRMPTGERIEVKSLARTALSVKINGLDQLDGGEDPLRLALVRLDDVGTDVPEAITPQGLISGLRAAIGGYPMAQDAFEGLLRLVGWQDDAPDTVIAVRLAAIEILAVDASFPRLCRGNVPPGVLDVDYSIAIPGREP